MLKIVKGDGSDFCSFPQVFITVPNLSRDPFNHGTQFDPVLKFITAPFLSQYPIL